MKRFACLLAAAFLLGWTAASPASANTLVTFSLNSVTFDDSTSATGGFTLDLTAGTITSASIATSFDSYSSAGAGFTNSPAAHFQFLNFPAFLTSSNLQIDLSVALTAANILGSPSFLIASGSEVVSSFFCILTGGVCSSHTLTGGSLDVTSVVNVAAVPVPATLPLFASGLGALGFLVRRKRKVAAAA